DKDNLMMTLEAGVPLMGIYEALEGTGLFFPPHPGDESAQIGAAVATNAGGARTVKYGVMRNYVKGAEVVLPTGEILSLGGKLMKHNAGYNLLQLLVGSEGTLGVFTKVILRLLPQPQQSMVLLLRYEDVESAISTVPDILKIGEIPMGLEYLERECITPSEKLTGKEWPAKGNAFLMVTLVGNSETELYTLSEKIAQVGEARGASDVLIAESKRDQETILNIRSNIYEALKPETIEILDVGVPPSMIARFVKKAKEIASYNKVPLPVYGHAADGNVHIHIMKTGLGEDWRAKYDQMKRQIFETCRDLGGVITAEHGVGLQKINDLLYSLTPEEIELMAAIKKIFDPNNIMNPGKVVPPQTHGG
ncbi:MAG: FAD-binding oxidoreductase, partial [Candidatus Bathyarchaeia archaeon]